MMPGYNIELKECPFCGGNAKLFVDGGVRVMCPKCGATSRILRDGMGDRGVYGNATKSVVNAWNMRGGKED